MFCILIYLDIGRSEKSVFMISFLVIFLGEREVFKKKKKKKSSVEKLFRILRKFTDFRGFLLFPK